jgi:hypothetical protein
MSKQQHFHKIIKNPKNPQGIFNPNPDPDPQPIPVFLPNPDTDPDQSQNVNPAGLYM